VSSSKNVRNRIAVAIIGALLAVASRSAAQQSQEAMAYTVSMPQPSNHLFHVALRVDGLRGEFRDFKMPAWHPGYYRETQVDTLANRRESS
jgi:hypothetical protein